MIIMSSEVKVQISSARHLGQSHENRKCRQKATILLKNLRERFGSNMTSLFRAADFKTGFRDVVQLPVGEENPKNRNS